MAEAFGVATGALAVASTGIKLSETLYTYVNTFRKTEKQLQPVSTFSNKFAIVVWDTWRRDAERDR